MPPEAVGELLKLGLPGIAILFLLYAVRTLYREKETQRIAAEKALADVTEKRIDEALKTVTALGKSESLMEKMSDNLERLTSAVGNIPGSRNRG